MKNLLCISFCFIFLAGCAPTTRTQGTSFTDPAWRDRMFESVVVEAKEGSMAERSALEDTVVGLLRRSGTQATASLDLIPPTRQLSGAPRKRAIMNTGAAAVLEIRPVEKWIVREYYPAEPYYHGRIRAFDHGYFYEPGYYSPPMVLNEPRGRFEAVLYTLPDYKTAWTGEFETAGPSGMDFPELSAHFAAQLVRRLQEDGLVAPAVTGPAPGGFGRPG